jgi:hypothetical protein
MRGGNSLEKRFEKRQQCNQEKGQKCQKMGGIGHVGGCREAPYDTRVSCPEGARALAPSFVQLTVLLRVGILHDVNATKNSIEDGGQTLIAKTFVPLLVHQLQA